ncbi:hypothetical protein BK816_02015 [Boudabousia tangfeifanii]|uniref:DUF885 domain-containing protein n=1 Tax=Boudabousia tangfeifanii TaxID=1912795 RepID=A0A1D9MJ62_9ACTO|nr:DUF885 domain-containing protein [Boudabousia tangfeifanii]AOZ72219.1 hypothetical protein BK816_02015 [Boudabousia tangfeifanii]
MNIDQIAEDFVEKLVEQSPELATGLGVDLGQDRWSDYSPEGVEADHELHQKTLAAIESVPLNSASDQVCYAAMKDRLGVQNDQYQLGEPWRNLNNISCPIQDVRDTMAQMDLTTTEGKANLAARLSRMSEAFTGYAQTLKVGVEKGLTPALRQVQAGINQLEALSAQTSLLDTYAEASSATQETLTAAKAACQELADFLKREVAPHAQTEDGVGAERYQVASHKWVGHQIDLDETYEWGQAELARIIAEQEAVAAELYGPGTSVEEAIERLNADPKYQLKGVDNLQEWMQQTADDVISKMDGVHFDIPAEIKEIECCIDKAGTGGIYYTGPSEDFSRPGRMWWSVPAGEDTFVTWQELTTVYHEGVPGHHLQIGQQMVEAGRLNRWRRQLCFNSGHAEGWALYSERLMDELGFFPDQGYRMGLLDGQRLRAARVVLDIGVHTGKMRPDGQGKWDGEYAWEFMKQNVAMAPGFLRFEVDRYLGWPGQAPSYKVGQRLWENLRDEYLSQGLGDLKDFHRVALREGTLPMQVLADVVLGKNAK